MRILVFAHDATLYGASQSLLTALEGLARRYNHNLLVLLPYPGKIEEKLKSLNVASKVIPFPRCVEFKSGSKKILKRFLYAYRYFRKSRSVNGALQKTVLEFCPDVIYTNTSVVSIGFRIASKFNIRHVWHVREFGDLDYNFFYIPTKKYVARCIAKSSHSIFGSETLRNSWLGGKQSQSSVIYNGVFDEISNFSPRSLDEQVTIGILGGIFNGKGHQTAVHALSIVCKSKPDAVLLIYGDVVDASYHQDLMKTITTLGLESNVIFKGFVNDKNEIYASIDLLLNCSRMEGFGRTLIEGMLHGVPVIANKSGGVLEIIEDGIDGLFYQETAESLAAAIIKVITIHGLYSRLSVNGLQKARKYSIPQYIAGIEKILHDETSPGLTL
jgi:glycosyltransferase involved in cell wall biosynthesis